MRVLLDRAVKKSRSSPASENSDFSQHELFKNDINFLLSSDMKNILIETFSMIVKKTSKIYLAFRQTACKFKLKSLSPIYFVKIPLPDFLFNDFLIKMYRLMFPLKDNEYLL